LILYGSSLGCFITIIFPFLAYPESFALFNIPSISVVFPDKTGPEIIVNFA
jgi:hypothetical protein